MRYLALILAIVFVVLAVLAWTGVAKFAPILGVDGLHHVKHVIAYLVLGLLCLVWMRFSGSTAR